MSASSFPGGPGGTGPGPVPLATAMSDRAAHAGAPGRQLDPSDPLARALLSLDSISSENTSGGGASSRREEILDGASALFAERGYHGASLRDISRRVGISHPGMLHHFSSKDVLLGAVIDRLEAHAQGLLNSADELGRSPESLIAAVAGPYDPTSHTMVLLATLSAEIVNPEHPGRFRIARLRVVHEHLLQTILQGFADKGRLREGIEPAFAARTLVSVLLSLSVRENAVRAQQSNGEGDPIRDLQCLIRTFLA